MPEVMPKWTKFQGIMTITMLVGGATQTISAKWTDRCEAVGIEGGKPKKFHHPYIQLGGMFLGEILCFAVFFALYYTFKRRGDGLEDRHDLTKGSRSYNQLACLPPALFDVCATSFNYTALNLTYASSFQMFRGSTIIFTALLRMAFFKRFPGWKQWIGMVMVILGLATTGLADHVSKDEDTTYDKTNVIIGDCMVLAASFLISCQNIAQEKWVVELDIPPLQAVGYEGVFGLATTILLWFIFYFVKADPPFTDKKGQQLENALDAFVQFGNSWQAFLSFMMMSVSAGLFNFSGMAIMKALSTLTKTVLDSVRTLVVYIASLFLFQQGFHYLQPVGFLILCIGVGLYNEISIQSFKEMCRPTKPLEDDSVEGASKIDKEKSPAPQK